MEISPSEVVCYAVCFNAKRKNSQATVYISDSEDSEEPKAKKKTIADTCFFELR
jgi:hypothetical protein